MKLESQFKQYVFVRKKYEEMYKEICNPKLHYVTWCIKLGEKNCSKTCYYAIKKIKLKNDLERLGVK